MGKLAGIVFAALFVSLAAAAKTGAGCGVGAIAHVVVMAGVGVGYGAAAVPAPTATCMIRAPAGEHVGGPIRTLLVVPAARGPGVAGR